MKKNSSDHKCILTEDQCNELDNIKITLWENTFDIEEGAKKLTGNLNKLTSIIKGTMQDPYYTGELMNVKRMSKFLEDGEIYELKDEKGKSYRKPGYYNNIIRQIGADCGCPSTNKRTEESLLKAFQSRL